MARVRNVHRRLLGAAPAEVGRLLDSLGGPEDRLWPRRQWPAMRLDGGLVEGAEGGHGPVRYVVTGHERGRWAEFTFTAPRGFHGTHTFVALPAEGGRTVLEHRLEMRTTGPALVSWPVLFRPLHDALLEDCLDRAEGHFGAAPPRRVRTPWVRLLRLLARGVG